jgi:hypothetical protein
LKEGRTFCGGQRWAVFLTKVAFAATNANSNPKWKCQPYAIKAINPKQVQR